MSIFKLPFFLFFLFLTIPSYSFHFPWEKEKRLFRPQFEFSRADNNYESVRLFYPVSDRKKVYCDTKESFVTISISSTLLSEGNSRTERKKVGIHYWSTQDVSISQISGANISNRIDDWRFLDIPYTSGTTTLCFSVNPQKNVGSAFFTVRVFSDDNYTEFHDVEMVIFFLAKPDLKKILEAK